MSTRSQRPITHRKVVAVVEVEEQPHRDCAGMLHRAVPLPVAGCRPAVAGPAAEAIQSAIQVAGMLPILVLPLPAHMAAWLAAALSLHESLPNT